MGGGSSRPLYHRLKRRDYGPGRLRRTCQVHEMSQINIVGVDTHHGFRTLELHEGDITSLDFHVDVLVFSAFAGSYIPSPGTVIQALLRRHRVDVEAESAVPALDVRTALGLWVSRPLEPEVPIGRLMCVEFHGSGLELDEILDNVFAGLTVLDAKGIPVSTVALPLLGTGLQFLPPEQIARELVPRARTHLQRSTTTSRIVFVEIDPSKAKLVSDGIDKALGRERVTLPQQHLVAALRQDIQHRIQHSAGLFRGGEHVREEWLRLLSQSEIRSIEFGIAARKLVEFCTAYMGVKKGPLAVRIREMETQGRVAPWLCAYMHVLRQLGNEAAHENASGASRIPAIVAPADLTAGLFCVQRLLEGWIEIHQAPTE